MEPSPARRRQVRNRLGPGSSCRWPHVLAVAWLVLGTPVGAGQSKGATSSSLRLGEPLRVDFAVASVEQPGCVRAQVLYGEERLAAHLVRAFVTGDGARQSIRVEADVAVSEPVVTVTVRTGCDATQERVFSLLPELADASNAASSGRPATPPQQGVVIRPERGPREPVASVDPRTRPAMASMNAVSRAGAVDAASLRRPQSTASRLKVDLWEEQRSLSPMRDLTLSAPSPDPQVRVAAQLMRAAVFKSVEETAGVFSQTDRLEANLALLRDLDRRRSRDLAELRSEVAAVNSWPPSAWIASVVALALSAASAAAALFFRGRPTHARRQSGHWPPIIRTDAPTTRPSPRPAAPVRQPAPAPGRSPQPTVTRNSSGAGNVERLLSVLQELELLAILTSWGACIDALQRYVTSSHTASPLPFLAFLRSCSAPFGDAHAREVVISMYEQCFDCPPPNPMLLDPAWGLERHPRVAAEVVALWGTDALPQALTRHLFARPRGDECLAVETGLELVFLLDLDAARRGESLQSSATAHPGTDPADAGHARSDFGSMPTRPAAFEFGPRLGFDIDLDDLERAVSASRS